ncbi:cullin family protein [Entamoeba histolytica HM-1:IMSS-B]|uniref:Cullin, putative n=6 Tax=Entamoeba histolytica TaxID=5759 RepID=C4M4E3_ENTH1|nr:cullin, putative [Entamoeba histolytica HM-1:IMSS]EMH77745.1 cullin family protein [Entamoeba histolytica HM-1:IMSS-B]EMS13271.1 cullin-1, putative [Entamoeba histolytica HM-3:IMSS]ENY59819.1 cullin-1, putative [Entamoeba histolytica HM-1:IMSS-A]GAT96236.1 cullin family protein [Entamoeba histolytica]EAL47520.1 cullin, putative [Entamoeba histolytica HM-1:IMSS]|eukprot:XP_652906.1 cullin, putative [Entamoeba histolytica HM-1:IMSS]
MNLQTPSQMFQTLSSFCDTVLSNQPYDSKTHMGMYSTCILYSQQTQGNAQKLFQLIHQKCIMKLKVLLKQTQQINSTLDFLRFYITNYKLYLISCQKISHVFSYLDRFFIKQQKAINGEYSNPVFKHCMSLFWCDFLRANATNIVENTMNLLLAERIDNNTQNRELINGIMLLFLSFSNPEIVTVSLMNLNIYDNYYQSEYIKAAQSYYKDLNNYFKNYGITEFLEKTIEIIELERQRSQLYVAANLQREFGEFLQKQFISEQCKFIIEKMESLLKTREKDDLKKCFTVLKDGEQVDSAIPVFEVYCKKIGMEKVKCIMSIQQAFEIIKVIIEYYEDITNLIQECFRNHPSFNAGFGRAFREIINSNVKIANGEEMEILIPEYLAKYSDIVVKKCVGVDELNNKLDQIFCIYDFIENKDIFENYYIKAIAKRMLLRGNNDDLSQENIVFDRHRVKFSSTFSYKIQKMMSDLQISQSLSNQFLATVNVPFPFFVNVLQTSVWPLEPQQFMFELPDELKTSHIFFEKWYIKQHQRRKLQWLHQYTRGKIKTNCFNKSYNLFGSAYQLSILVLFNQKNEITIDEIFNTIHLTMDIIKSIISSLQSVDLISVEDGNIVKINNSFKYAKTKFVLPIPKAVVFKQEKKEEEREITAERVGLIEACIVRLMKKNRKMQHNDLMQAVVTSLSSRFRTPIPLVRRTIESLIEREYISRSDVRKDEYIYIE